MHQHTSDDAVLLEHLQLANQQLRQVLAAAGCSLPELSLPTNFAQLLEDEAMALLAEENYQLRQLLQQLQQQQQLEELEQQLILQQELELKRSALEFDRLSPSPEQQQCVDPAPAAAACAETPQFGSPMASSRTGAYGSVTAAAPENATVMSPAAARLVAAPSLYTVQLVEAEAAAQLATQAVIHAEAVAHHHMPWQPQDPLQDDRSHDMSAAGHVDTDDELNLICHEQMTDVEHAGSHDDSGGWQHGTTPYSAVSAGAQAQGNWLQAPAAAETGARDHEQQQRQLDSSGCMALPQLPRLQLPAAVRATAHSSCHVEVKGLSADTPLQVCAPVVVSLQGCEQPAQTSMGVQQPRLSAFGSAGAAAAAAVAAAELPDVFASDQWQRQLQQQSQPQLPPPLQQSCQQQQQQREQQHGLNMQMLGLPPIATTAVRGGPGGPAIAAQATSAAVSQAAAAAAALAQQSFYPPPPPPPPQQLQQQQQQQQLLLPLPALRLPPKVQTYEHQQCQHTGLPPLLEHQPMPSSSATSSWHADVPLSLPKLRLPASHNPAAASSNAAGPSGCAGAASHSSSPEDSPCSDSAFFRAADAGLFDGSSSGLFDGGTDLFGARISMDDSGQHLSCSEAQPSQLPEVPEDYFGLPESSANSFQGGEHGSSSYCVSQQSGWLGVSYQQQSLRAGQYGNFSTGRASQEFQQPYAGTSGEYGSFSGYPHCRGMGQGAAAGVGMSSVDELSELREGPLARQDTWSGSGFIATAAAGSMSSLTSGMLSNQVSFRCPLSTQHSAAGGAGAHSKPAAAASREQEQEQLLALPNLAPLRVATSRQQEHTPPLTWQPRPLQGDDSSSSMITGSRSGRLPASAAAAAAAAATSPAHMAATEAAEAAASVGLAAAATGGMDSQQLQQLLHHLARVAEEASTTVAAAAAAAAGSPAPSSTGQTPHAAAAAGAAADAAGPGAEVAAHVCQEQQQQQQQHEQLLDGAAAADAQCCCTPTANKAHALRATLSGPILGQPARPLSPFAAAGTQSPAPAGTAFLVMSPRPSMLQRTLSAGQMAHGCATGLPPKWASRSGSSSNLAALHTQQQQQQQECPGNDADRQIQGPSHCMGQQAPAVVAVPGLSAADRAVTAPVATSAGCLISPRLGLHRRLRVNTHAAAPAGPAGAGCASNGSNSDAEAGSAHTTPMHRPPQGGPVQRTSSGSSFRPAGLASITVPPSPASSGVRYVPASPRVVGFDCPLTPHMHALRSPSWRSDVGVEGSSMGCGSMLACGSGASTPRRQASSPGLLQQALARSGLAPHQHHSQPQLALSGAASAAGSSCTTPCSAARRAAAGAGTSGFAAAAAAVPGAGVCHDKLQLGSHGSSCGVPRTAGSCSSTALLMTMMGGQLPVLHQRTYSSPYLDTMQSPKAAPRTGRGSASGHLEAADDAAGQAAAPAAAQAHLPELLAPGNSHVCGSNASSRRCSSSSNASSPGHKHTGSSDADARGSAAAAEAVAVDACVDVSRSVSPQLAAPNSRSISPQLRHDTSPRAQGPPAAAAGDAGHPRLSRFGLAAARAGVGGEKPAASSSSSKAPKEEAHGRLAACVGLTAAVPVGSQQGGGLPSALHDYPCAGSSSSSNRQHGCNQQAVLEEAAAAAAGGAGDAVSAPAVTGVGASVVAVPDTPALEAAGVVGAFSGQCSSSNQGCALSDQGGAASLAGVLIEQELQRVAAEACCSAGSTQPAEATSSSAARHCSHSVQEGLSPASGAFEACAPGSNNPSCSRKGALVGGACCSGDAAPSRQRDASWQPAAMTREGSNALEQQHQPPASPCTPQQDAEQQQQQQQQQLQSPEGQHHLNQQADWQLQQQGRWQQQRAQHQALWSGHTISSPHKACALPRSKSAAAYLSGASCSGAAAAGAGAGAAVQGSPGQGPNTTSGMWSPTHDVRGGSSRHRAPSALLMRLSQRQVEVLLARGKSTSAVPYVLPHRSSNPASALRALASTGSGDHSSNQVQGHGCSQDQAALLSSPRANAASRSSLELASSGSSPHASQHLEGMSSWEVEQLHVPQDLLDVASSAAAVPDLYIPVPRADSAALEAQQQQQQQQQQLRQQQVSESDTVDAAAAGSSDQCMQLLSACIVQQRLKSSGKWLGPAPIMSSASTAAAEAEAAAVVTRRRSSQSGTLGAGPGLQRSRSSGTVSSPSSSGGRVGSRVAMTAAVLAASSGAAEAAAAGPGPVRVCVRLRPAAAWRVDVGDRSPEGPQGDTGVQQRARQGARLQHEPNPEQQGNRQQCQEPGQQQQQQQQQERASDSGLFAGGSSAMPSSSPDACLQPADGDAALVGEAVSTSSSTEAAGPAVLSQHQQLSLVPHQHLIETAAEEDLPEASCDLPSGGLAAGAGADAADADACEPPASALQDVLPAAEVQQQQQQQQQQAMGSPLLQPAAWPAGDSRGGSQDAAHERQDGVSPLPAVPDKQQQQLLMWKQQQRRKQREVAEWARLLQQQQHDQGLQQQQRQEENAPVAGVEAASAASAAAGSQAATASSMAEAAAVGSSPIAPAPAAALTAAAIQPAASTALDEASKLVGGVEAACSGMQRVDSACISIADSFEVQSWAAWSTTSSINRCPKLQWWGDDAGQGRFSTRQRSRRQLQGSAGGAGSVEAQVRWWQRLLQARQAGSSTTS